MNKGIISLCFLCMILVSACEFDSKTPVLDPGKQYKLYDYYEDAEGNKGIVAFVLEDAYTIVISADEYEAAWGPMGELVYDRDTFSNKILNDDAFGLAVLQSMRSRGIDRFPAQAWCNSKNPTGSLPNVGSWRLPSHDEMTSLFGIQGSRVNRLNYYLARIGGDFVDKEKIYWTCVEDFDDYLTINNVVSDYDKENRAIARTPTNKVYSNKDHWIKKNTHFVRAIKYIYYEK